MADQESTRPQEALLIILNELFKDMDYASVINIALANLEWNKMLTEKASQIYGKATPVAKILLTKGRKYACMGSTSSRAIPRYTEASDEWDLLIHHQSFVEKLLKSTDRKFQVLQADFNSGWPKIQSSAMGNEHGKTWAKATLFNHVFLFTLLYDIACAMVIDKNDTSLFAALTLKYIDFVRYHSYMLRFIALAAGFQNSTPTRAPQFDHQAFSLKRKLLASGKEAGMIITSDIMVMFSQRYVIDYQEYLKQKKIEKAKGEPFSWDED